MIQNNLFTIMLLLAIVMFCIFRISEMHWRVTFWADSVGYILVSISSFWNLVVKLHQLGGGMLLWDSRDDLASTTFLFGVTLILWSATCNRLRRRTHERTSLVERRV